MATPSLELGRLFSLMEGVDPEGLFNAALLRAAGGELGAAGLPTQLTPRLQTGLEGLEERGAGRQADGSPSGDMDGNGSTDDEDDKTSMGGLGGGPPAIPPRTGCINDRKCTKVLPASSSAPKYKFVVPNEYVYKFMKHLVERPFHMRDMGGKLWECVLIQRKNKEKYEYMIQGWRRFGEATGVQEGDTVTIEMVDESTMQLTLEHTGGGSAKKRRKGGGGGGGGGGHAPLPQERPSPSAPVPSYVGSEAARAQMMAPAAALPRGGDEEANGLLVGGGRVSQQAGGPIPSLGVQQGPGPPQQLPYGGGMDEGGGGQAPQGLLALIQQQHQQQAGAHGGGGPGQPLTPRSLSAHLASGLSGPLGQLAGGSINEAQLADLTAVISQLERRQRVGDPPLGAGPGGGGGAMHLLSNVADLDKVMHENMALREELRMMQAKIATLETGVLNIKSVLTRNTDPGLIAMTGVINLLNQMESADFLPELGTIGRMSLTGLCSEVRRHLNGVLRMVWILRSLPDDVQQHNMGAAPASSGGGP